MPNNTLEHDPLLKTGRLLEKGFLLRIDHWQPCALEIVAKDLKGANTAFLLLGICIQCISLLFYPPKGMLMDVCLMVVLEKTIL